MGGTRRERFCRWWVACRCELRLQLREPAFWLLLALWQVAMVFGWTREGLPIAIRQAYYVVRGFYPLLATVLTVY